jgi:cytochrome c
MKKVLVTLSLITVLVACGSNESGQNTGTETTTAEGGAAQGEAAQNSGTEPAVVDLSSNPDYQAGLALEAKSDCATCHKLDEKLVGPSFREIAAKYTEKDIDMLAGKVINGGAGNWGQVPMTPHPQLSQDDAKTIVKYILLLKK